MEGVQLEPVCGEERAPHHALVIGPQRGSTRVSSLEVQQATTIGRKKKEGRLWILRASVELLHARFLLQRRVQSEAASESESAILQRGMTACLHRVQRKNGIHVCTLSGHEHISSKVPSTRLMDLHLRPRTIPHAP